MRLCFFVLLCLLCAGLPACADDSQGARKNPAPPDTALAEAATSTPDVRPVPARADTQAARASGSAASDPSTPVQPPLENAAPQHVDTADEFSQVLAQYQAFNRRLETVAARLQRANALLCPAVVRHPGYSVHTISDYPENLRAVARPLLGVDEGLSIRSVHAGSPADEAGLRPKDKLIGLNGQRFASGQTQMQFYRQLSSRAFAQEAASLTLARQNSGGAPQVFSTQITPETLCDYPAHVVFDPNINGHTDGKAIWITSALMHRATDDASLALIIAHEMAHAISGDIQGRASKTLELQADRMALVMMTRAGFDTECAVNFWTRVDSPQNRAQMGSETHPSASERRANFARAQVKINAAQNAGETLDFRTVN